MNEDATQHLLSPYEYVGYLEKLSNDEFWDHARTLASRSAHPMQDYTSATSSSTSILTCVTCSLREGERCLLPFTVIQEVLPVSQYITRLPDVPSWMIGILSWRGETIAAIDLCAYVRQKVLPSLQERVTLIVQHEGISLAFCVLAINEVPTIVDVAQIIPFPPSYTSDSREVPLQGVVGTWTEEANAQKQTLILDMPLLFKDILQQIERKARHV